MTNDRKRVLDMLAAGKITADEADRLLSAMGRVTVMPPQANVGERRRPKYLRVTVDSDENGPPTKVNIRVPMQLLYAGVRLSALIPPEARDQVDAAMRAKGVNYNLSQLKPENLEDLVDQLDELTVDVDNEHTKVRIFCE